MPPSTTAAHPPTVASQDSSSSTAEENLRDLSLIYNAMSDGLFAVAVEDGGKRFRYLSVNPAFLHRTGLREDQVVGKPLQSVLHGEALQLGRKNARKSIRTRETVRWDSKMEFPAGIRYGEVTLTPVFDQNGHCTHLVGSIHDETERMEAIRAMRESQARLQALFDHAANGMLLVSDPDRIVDVNPATYAMLGYTREEILKLTVADLVAPGLDGISPDIQVLWKEFLREGRLRGAIHLRRKDGAVLWVSYTAVANVQPGLHLTILTDITRQVQAEEALRESEDRFRQIADSAPVMIWVSEEDGNCSYLNRPWLDFTGQSMEAGCGMGWAECIHPDDREAKVRDSMDAIAERRPMHWEYRLRRHDGHYRWVLDVGAPRFSPKGAYLGYIGSAIDITDQKAMQAQVVENQKLESLGRLAGGVAHDFNNLLTAIGGYAQLALDETSPDSRVHGFLQNVCKAAERAADLTRQLLAYARRQIVEMSDVDVNEVIRDFKPLMDRALGENHTLAIQLSDEPCVARTNAGQIEQVLMNLVVNARDAMPGGGRIYLETAAIHLDPEYAASHVGVAPGDYVCFSVTDTGTGLHEEHRGRIFDPFFTTKEMGKGIGLGLATCYGIVKQNRGNIWVYSELGMGTTFKVYLPRAYGSGVSKPTPPAVAASPVTATILVVDDEPMVRSIAARILSASGYRVIEAKNGADALHVQSEISGPIDLLLTDAVMPLMGGKELAERIAVVRPGLPVVFMSGYTDDVLVQEGIVKPNVILIDKPFTGPSLLAGIESGLRQAEKSRA